jgi:ABC-type glycerol-3-phosphate transport system substrate-binding protein
MLDSPECIRAVQFMYDLVYKHHIAPTPTEDAAMAATGGWGSGPGNILNQFAAGHSAMTIGERWWLCRYRTIETPELELEARPLPRAATGKIPGYGKATLINANTPHKEGALEFLKYLHSQAFNELINHQADAICAVKEYAYTERFLHDPAYPEEDFNRVWRDALERALPAEVSPFVSGNVSFRLIMQQIDLLKNNTKTPRQAMTDAAARINARIVEKLRANPTLKEQYMALIEAGARPAWNRPEDAP